MVFGCAEFNLDLEILLGRASLLAEPTCLFMSYYEGRKAGDEEEA